MDVLVAGGVTIDNVRAQFEIWAGVGQELGRHLRAELGKPAAVVKIPERPANASASPARASA
jgi:hypothetical protein